MRLLVLHQNFPGQFGHLVSAWQRLPGWEVRGLGRDTAPGLPGFDALHRYRLARPGRAQQHPYLRSLESATLHGQAVARTLLQWRQQGYKPDAVLAHPGWGESLYVKDVFPDARLVHLCEWYYAAEGTDLGFDPEFALTFDHRARIRTWNSLHALNLLNCDQGIAPTQWQRNVYPEIFRPRIVVQHEGIDLAGLSPDRTACLRTPDGAVLRAGDPVVTYVARNLEPYRGFHVFMRALRALQQRHRHVHAVIVGGDEVSYGPRPKDAPNWRQRLLREVSLDASRTHFMGRLPRAEYVKVLQVSAAHVYLTYPFVLSWSLLEAMACGANVVASDTAPVREVLRDGVNGRLVPFFDPVAIADAALRAVEERGEQVQLREAARRSAMRFSPDEGAQAYAELLGGTETHGEGGRQMDAASPSPLLPAPPSATGGTAMHRAIRLFESEGGAHERISDFAKAQCVGQG